MAVELLLTRLQAHKEEEWQTVSEPFSIRVVTEPMLPADIPAVAVFASNRESLGIWQIDLQND